MATDRINPDTVSVGGLKPQATPVDTMIHLSKDVDLSKEKSLMATAEGIANFGKGMIEIQPVLQDHALREANKIYEKNIAQNKREWKDASDKGFAKFNPYTKDYYNQLMSDEVVMSKWAKFLKDNPRFEYETPDIADAKLKEFKADVIQTLEDRKYSSRQIEGALTKSAALASNKSLEYYDKYATVEYGRGLNAYSNSLSNKIINTTFDETTTLDGVINTECAIARENGFTREDTAKAVEDSLKRTIKYKMMNDPTFTTKNRAEYMAALDNLTIDGVSIKDINPNLKQNISDHFDQVQAEVWSLENRQFDQYQKQQKMIAATIMSELGTMDLTDTDALIDHAQKSIVKYNLQGEAQVDILNFINGLRKAQSNVEDGYSDPKLYKELLAGVYMGEVKREDIISEQSNLTSEDMRSLLNHLDDTNAKNRDEVYKIVANDTKRFEASLKRFGVEQIQDKNERNAFMNQMREYEIDLRNQVIASPDKVAAGKNYQKQLYEYTKNLDKYYKNYKDKKYYEQRILNNTKPFQYQNRVGEDSGFLFFRSQYNTKISKQYKIGDKPNKGEIAYNPKITSAFAEPRTGYKHQGIDVGTPEGDLCVNPFGDGTIIAVGYDKGGYGNFITLDLGDGYTATFGHLSSPVSGAKKGAQVPSGTVLAYTGNTGKSTGAHTDISIRKNGVPVNPYKYLEKIKGKK